MGFKIKPILKYVFESLRPKGPTQSAPSPIFPPIPRLAGRSPLIIFGSFVRENIPLVRVLLCVSRVCVFVRVWCKERVCKKWKRWWRRSFQCGRRIHRCCTISSSATPSSGRLSPYSGCHCRLRPTVVISPSTN